MSERARHLTLLALLLCKKKKEKRKPRRIWCKDYLNRRIEKGTYSNIFRELRFESEEDFVNYTRLNVEEFRNLFELIAPKITRSDTNMREAITPGAKLEATLRFLATGESYASLRYSTRISSPSLSLIIPEVCAAIYDCLHEEFLKFPSSEDEWREIAHNFQERWNFPNCIGAIDGKHVSIVPPPNNGSYYYNYKGTHSMILLAVCNANYEFIYVDFGRNGRVSDAGVWGNCSLQSALEKGVAKIPDPVALPNSDRVLPFVFVADDAFPLTTYMLKPYPFRGQSDSERIFSYRLSRARRMIENAFGLLSSKFRVLRTTINLKPENVEKVVKACLVLHNYIRKRRRENEAVDREDHVTGHVIPGPWRNEDPLLNLQTIPRKPAQEAQRIRDDFKNYFLNEGQVPWQRRMCHLD